VNSLTDDEKREVLRVAQSLGLTEARDAKPHAARALRGSA
jgi:hypothetical protein